MGFLAEDIEATPICTDEDSFERGAAFDDLDLRVRSRAFQGGRVTAVMCGVTIDLREAGLGPEGATISVQAAMGGIEIIVPRDWDVVCDVQAVWGSVDGKRFPPTARDRGPRLRLTGMVVAGGLRIR